MDKPKQEESPNLSWGHSPEQIEVAKANLVACLEALRKNGEQGLKAELERINPSPDPSFPLPNSPGISEDLLEHPFLSIGRDDPKPAKQRRRSIRG